MSSPTFLPTELWLQILHSVASYDLCFNCRLTSKNIKMASEHVLCIKHFHTLRITPTAKTLWSTFHIHEDILRTERQLRFKFETIGFDPEDRSRMILSYSEGNDIASPLLYGLRHLKTPPTTIPCESSLLVVIPSCVRDTAAKISWASVDLRYHSVEGIWSVEWSKILLAALPAHLLAKKRMADYFCVLAEAMSSDEEEPWELYSSSSKSVMGMVMRRYHLNFAGNGTLYPIISSRDHIRDATGSSDLLEFTIEGEEGDKKLVLERSIWGY